MTDDRKKITDAISEEMFGPLDPDSEEILSDAPTKRYFCGVLFPKNIPDESEAENEHNTDKQQPDDEDEHDYSSGVTSIYDLSDEQESDLNLSNAFKQSAISISVALRKTDKVIISLFFAYYEKIPNSYSYKRCPKTFLSGEISFAQLEEATKHGDSYQIKVLNESGRTLSIRVFPRWNEESLRIFTISAINETVDKGKNEVTGKRKIDEKSVFFQVKLSVHNSSGFAPFPERIKAASCSDDEANNALLHRKVNKYAVGHGCSPVWDDRTDSPKDIDTAFLPSYELKAVIASTNEDLNMYDMYSDTAGLKTFTVLKTFCDGYERWIAEQKNELLPTIPEKYFKTAETNIKNCEECLARMRRGCLTLQNNSISFLAFRLMNKAMLLQQIHSKLKTKKLVQDKFGNIALDEKSNTPMPDIDNLSVENKAKYGHWRAFQLGFVLLSIESIVDKQSEDRSLVDLIWFPTGGGKTEAYLGLTSFALLYGRLTKEDTGDCTKVFMRYTLRLLTSQQYQRAAALVCSLEHMRREDSGLLGGKPFSIGLWVGGSSTPNTNIAAIQALNSMNNPRADIKLNPFVISQCPWCGAEMGSDGKRIFGYHKTSGTKGEKKVVFACDNPNCEFHAKSQYEIEKTALPLMVVDEYIYNDPPSILIGTVDKFAMVPFKKDARNLFGLRNGLVDNRSHPELIIQDELHLITGPLGSAVACYETMFDALCSYEKNGQTQRPKIVASTATISQAKEQCHAIFDVSKEQVKIFPSPAIDANETYFSKVDSTSPGRKYVGVYAPGAESQSTANIHFLSAMLASKYYIDWGTNNEAKDAYWTNICYFNAIRELAQAKTWQDADVREAVKRIEKRKGLNEKDVPFFITMEMNSRNGDQDVSAYLKALNIEVSGLSNAAEDIVYSTNMFSVGVDIERLGLMTVFGQPKTASEYIQATSRVGRSKNRPGLIYVLYNRSRPRDKSIFEEFEFYHSRLYATVEPMTVAPFSTQLRKKVIPSLLVSIASSFCTEESGKNDPVALSDKGYFSIAKQIILGRVNRIEPEEYDNANKQIDSILNRWIDKEGLRIITYPMTPQNNYQGMGDKPAPAIVPESTADFLPSRWENVSLAVPTSMRSVDQTSLLTMFWNISATSGGKHE